MVGIVVVSHSRPLARASVGLAKEMVHGRDVRIAVAARLDEATLGTDAVQIKAAIEEVAARTVCWSSWISAAPYSARSWHWICSMPTCGRGSCCVRHRWLKGSWSPRSPPREASRWRAWRRRRRGRWRASSRIWRLRARGTRTPLPFRGRQPPGVTGVFVVGNEHGLHARPAARLVGEVRALDARVTLRNLTTGSPAVPAGSLSRVATLGALRGHRVEVSAEGRQAQEALEHVLALAMRNFDDVPASGLPASGLPATGLPASAGPLPAVPGIAIGPVWFPKVGTVQVLDEPAGDPATEWRRLRTAVAAVRRETVRLKARTLRELGESEAAIFDAHLMLLDDTELLDHVRRGIDGGHAAEAAWAGAIRLLEDQMAGLADPYQRARAADVRSVGDQVLRSLLGIAAGFDSARRLARRALDAPGAGEVRALLTS